MKKIIVLAIAVMAGIWLYRQIQAGKLKKVDTSTGTADGFAGPDIDPKTGAYLPAGVSSGTVEFSAQGN